MSAVVSRQQRRWVARKPLYRDHLSSADYMSSRPYRPYRAKPSKSDNPAYRKSIWPASKIARRNAA